MSQMQKVAVVTDTNASIPQEILKNIDVTVVPMPFDIDGLTYFEGVTIDENLFYDKLLSGAQLSTSQPSPLQLKAIWDELLKTHDQICYIPMSSALSSSCESAQVYAKDYGGKVAVVDNKRIAATMEAAVFDALRLKNLGLDAFAIKEVLEQDAGNSSIYITVDSLHWLKKGGRITPAVYAIGTMLRLKPILKIQGGKLDAFAKARTMQSAQKIMLNAMKSDIKKRFGLGNDYSKVKLYVVHSHEHDKALKYLELLKQTFTGSENIELRDLSFSIACHTGPGCMAIAAVKKMV